MHIKKLARVATVAGTAVASLIAIPVGQVAAVATLSKSMPAEALLDAPIPVTLVLTNPGGPDGFNASFNDTLPAGVSYVPGSSSPAPQVLPQSDGSTVLVWTDVADSFADTTVSLGYEIIADDPSFDVGSVVANSANVFVSSNPRNRPDFDPTTGAILPDPEITSDAASASTELIPFEVTKSEPSPEGELLRGVHDQQTVFTLTVDTNLRNPTNDFRLVDYLSAELEFLGCGDVDNTTGAAEEYTGAGVINPGNAPALANCVDPSSVTTVTIDPDGTGSLPEAVYTRVEWDAAALGQSLAAGGSFSIDYVAAIPMFANTQVDLAEATANLDNNTGAITTETSQPAPPEGEGLARNFAIATGDYISLTAGGEYSDDDTLERSIEDIRILKSVDDPGFEQGDTPSFTLTIDSSEYATATGLITVTDTIPAGLDFVSASPDADAGPVFNADGTKTYTWVLGGFGAPNATTEITIDTVVRDFYRGPGGVTTGRPVASRQSFTNVTDLVTDVTVITDATATEATFSLVDESAATLSSGGPSIFKRVSNPVAGVLTCGDGTAASPTYADDVAGAPYRPGDRVCFELNVDFPDFLDTLDPVVQDLLPPGFEFESFEYGSLHNIDPATITAPTAADAGDSFLTWTLPDVDVASYFQVIISSLIVDPSAARDADIVSNLQKFRHGNDTGEIFQLRDQADAPWAEPELALAKGVIELDGGPVAGAPADGVSVEASDVVTYAIDVRNDGGIDAENVSIRDVLPAGISCDEVSDISGGGVCSLAEGWIQWDDPLTVAAGSSQRLTYDVTVPAGVTADQSLVNTAGVRTFTAPTNTGTPFTYVPADNIDPTLTPNTDPADDTSSIVTATPQIDKSANTSIISGANGNDAATIGETIEYTVEVTIPDGLTYPFASIIDVLDDEKDLDVASPSATLDGVPLPTNGLSLVSDDAANSWSINFPDNYVVPDGTDQTLIVTFDAVVLDVASNVRSSNTPNTATFVYDGTPGAERDVDDSVGTVIVEPNITIDKNNDDVDGVVSAGQVVNYDVVVTNDDGPGQVSTAYDTLVVDTVPAELTVLTAPGGVPVTDGGTVGPDGGVWDEDARTITWVQTMLQPGASRIFDYQVVVDDPLVAAGVLTNDVTATTSSLSGDTPGERVGDSPNGGPGSGYTVSTSSTVTVPVVSVAKSADPSVATIGEPITYTVDVTVPGGVIAFDTIVIDRVPDGIVFESLVSVSCDQGGGACSPDVGVADVDVVPSGTLVSGADVAFFFDDVFATEAVDDRVVTITYVGVVADAGAAANGATLTNSATASWNTEDRITETPTAVPDPATFDETSDPSSTDVDVVEPTFAIDKDVDGQIDDTDTRRAVPGDVLVFTLDVVNIGDAPAFDVTVTDVASDPAWAFANTTDPGVATLTPGVPTGGNSWTIVGPIADGDSVEITYTLTVPADFDETDEVLGPESTNIADVPSYFGVGADDRVAFPDRDFREYDDVTADVVTIEVDLASIGDLVWFDIDGDGDVDPGETPLAGVDIEVIYLGPDGLPGGGDDEIFTATTDADGRYLVENLPGGEYTVSVDSGTLPAGVVPTFDLDGGTASPNGSWTGSLGEDEAKRDVDFGYRGTGSIGDTIWFDQNTDGVVDPNEAGIAGVDVTVAWHGPDGIEGNGDDVTVTTTTDANGEYVVDGLPLGDYTVTVDTDDLPAGFSNVSDPDGGDDSTSQTSLTAGEDRRDQDFGYAGIGSIGDTVYLDQNGDGDQDVGEPGLVGVMVDLVSFGPDGIEGTTDDSIFSTTTGPGGAYLFDALPPGDYRVDIVGAVPANVVNTADPDGGGDSTSITTLTVAEPDDLDQDFGYFADSVLGDRVWWDFDRDGAQDPGEPGLPGLTVTASGPAGLVFTTTTDANGDYLFTDIPDGDWTVVVSAVPAGFEQTYDASGSQTVSTSTTSIRDQELLQDFGYVGTSSLGDRVWIDTNADGVQDAGEPGIEGVDVELTWAGPDGVFATSDDVVFVDTTDADGVYGFDGLPAGEYTVQVVETDPDFPAGVDPSFDRDGGTVDPDGLAPVTLAANEDLDDVDFGYVGGGSIGDTVWFDRDGDGVLDADEFGIAGVDVTVTWFGPDGIEGTADDETFVDTTDADGNYLVQGLPAGGFRVAVDTADLPDGMSPTFDADGGLDDQTVVDLADGEDRLDQDFGYRGSGAIGDTVYLDLDGDGSQGSGEPGVPNQTVVLTWDSPSGPVTFTTTTDAAGNYLFDGLPAGDYEVEVVGGIVDRAVNSDDPDGGADSRGVVPLGAGETDLDQDFGYVGTNSIGDTVWFDIDADGVDDAGEPRLADVEITVTWFGPDGVLGGGDDIALPTATTLTDGTYFVDGLPDGSYSVEVTGGVPAGLENTFDADGGLDARSTVTDLGVGSDDGVRDLDQDFGFSGTGLIGDTVWLDLDRDGGQDPSEPGIPGVQVALVGAGNDGVFGTADDVVFATQETDADGNYLFERLPADDYRVTVSGLPGGVSNTFDPDGGADGTSALTLGAGVDDDDQDFGYAGTASVGDLVWIDLDGDGTPDAGEPGIPGLDVTLTHAGADGVLGTEDDIVITTDTDENGNYLFDGLPPGNIEVSYDPSDLAGGLGPSSDLDGGSASTSTFALDAGEDRLDVDFAVIGDATIEGTVFEDTDGDGVQDPGEPGIPDVDLEVTWNGPDGRVVIVVTTDDDGDWSIDSVPSGDYDVDVVLTTVPDGFEPTTPTSTDVTVPPGGTGRTDHGFATGGSIGDRIWFDTDDDGIQDPGEAGAVGIRVDLFDEDGLLIATTTTDANGEYLFDDLPAGVYTVRVDTTTILDGVDIGFDRDGDNDGSTTVALGPNEDIADVDVGLIVTVGELPSTGSDGPIRTMALGVLLLGLGLILLASRRSRPGRETALS
ncbi:MAG: SdrD B-like domain-containing protein [Ilumatobacter sp.]